MIDYHYWSVYKNLEHELITLSQQIHIDDKQLEVYSTKITELLIRSAVEFESISKKLYYDNGGTKPIDKHLYYEDCMAYLEGLWLLSQKVVRVAHPNFHLNNNENQRLTPLNKANKRSERSAKWLIAYQAVKHNRLAELRKGNLKNFIQSLAALYILNLYNNNQSFNLGDDRQVANFKSNIGSEIFSVQVHRNDTIKVSEVYTKNSNFNNCIYLIKYTDVTRAPMVEIQRRINAEIKRRNKNNLSVKGLDMVSRSDNSEVKITEAQRKEELNRIRVENKIQIHGEFHAELSQLSGRLQFEAVLNKNQF